MGCSSGERLPRAAVGCGLALKNEWDLNIHGHREGGPSRRQKESEFQPKDRDELDIFGRVVTMVIF